MPAMHLRITGKVQGVFFRATAKLHADQLGIVGWIRNCADGAVEVHAEGDKQSLEHFIEWCSEGPKAAKVTSVEAHHCNIEDCTSFEIRES